MKFFNKKKCFKSLLHILYYGLSCVVTKRNLMEIRIQGFVLLLIGQSPLRLFQWSPNHYSTDKFWWSAEKIKIVTSPRVAGFELIPTQKRSSNILSFYI